MKKTEDFVKSCDQCQMVEKAGEKNKPPLNLEPIISEVFSKLSCDSVGPMPKSNEAINIC